MNKTASQSNLKSKKGSKSGAKNIIKQSFSQLCQCYNSNLSPSSSGSLYPRIMELSGLIFEASAQCSREPVDFSVLFNNNLVVAIKTSNVLVLQNSDFDGCCFHLLSRLLSSKWSSFPSAQLQRAEQHSLGKQLALCFC